MSSILAPARQARILATQGQYDEALDLLQVVLQAAPTADDWAFWASLKQRAGCPSEAEAGYRRALELNPSGLGYEAALNDIWKRERGQGEARTLKQRGQQLLRAGEARKAAPVLYQAIRAQETAELWNDWASAHFLLERYGEAEAGFSRALTLDPGNMLAAGNLAVTLYRMKRPVEAISWARRALESASPEARPAWRSLLAECEAVIERGGEGDAGGSRLLAETSATMGRLVDSVGKLQQSVEELQKRIPQPAAPSDEQVEARTLLDVVPASRLIPVVSQCRLVHPGTSADPLPLSERWLLGALAGMLPDGDLLHWGPKNAITMDLAANCTVQATVWYVADPGSGGDPLEPSRLAPVREELQSRMRKAPVQSSGFDASAWLGRMRLIVVECGGTAAQVRQFTRTVLPFLAAESAVMVWYGYGCWNGATLALNELYLAEPGLARMVRIADSGLAVLVR